MPAKTYDSDYLKLVHAFEGDEQTLKARRSVWIALAKEQYTKLNLPVLDLGSGDSWLLDILKDSGVPGVGIEQDADSIRRAKAKGHEVYNDDVVDWFTFPPTANRRFSTVFILSLIEHLDTDRAFILVKTCAARLPVGGKVVVLTPNMSQLEVLTHSFWLDASHVRPYPAAIIDKMFQLVGLKQVESGTLENGYEIYLIGEKV